MRICYVATDITIPGMTGGSTHTFELARHLVEIGHKVFVICRREAGQKRQEMLEGVQVFRIYRGLVLPTRRTRWKAETGPRASFYSLYLRTVFLIFAAVQIAQVIRRADADIILERGTSSGEGALASTICRRPTVLEIIGPRFSSLSFHRARKVLAFSFKALGHYSKEKVRLVTAAANTEMFSPTVDGSSIRREFSLEQAKVVGYAGSFAPWHGMENLLQAMRIVAGRSPKVRLLLIGPGPEAAKALSSRLGLDSHAIFTGAVPYDSVPRYLAACDALVAPYSSKYGGDLYSYVKIYEYLAVGKPVITTNVVPDATLLRATNALIIVPSDDPPSLAQAILDLLEDEEMQSLLSQRARIVASEHSWRGYARQLSQLLQETVSDAYLQT